MHTRNSIPGALAVCFCLGARFARGVSQGTADALTPMYIDLQDYLTDSRNVIRVSLDALQTGLATPNLTDKAQFSGFDWTRPYPGESITGHTVNLRAAYDVPMPASTGSDSTSSVTSLTYSVPDTMMDDAKKLPKPMHDSWAVCRHVYVSTKPSGAVDHTCGFLGPQCISDLKDNMTAKWWRRDSGLPCGGVISDPIPRSCEAAFGFATAYVSVFGSADIADPVEGRTLTVDEQGPYNWRIGTGFHAKGTKAAYDAASARTYLVANVWGYSDMNTDGKKTPEAILTCLRGVQGASAGTSPVTVTTTQASQGATGASLPQANAAIVGRRTDAAEIWFQTLLASLLYFV